MRIPDAASRERLQRALSSRAGLGAAELAAQAKVSVPTLHRQLKELGDAVFTHGLARRARYALRRGLRGSLDDLPLYEIDAAGRAHFIERLALLRPFGSHVELHAHGWPVPAESQHGWWDGLPYPLYDMRPQGYMGRQFALAEHRQLAVPSDPTNWNDDDIVYVLSRAGHDTSGNLVLGDAAIERWQAGKRDNVEPVNSRAVARTYVRLAEDAIAQGVPGSSAGGEFPKFAALRELAGSKTAHVLVKFSGHDDSSAVRRWSDLLVCEHLAAQHAGTLPGVTSAASRIVQAQGRTFLEVERFDRVGRFGRVRLNSLATLDAALLGDGSSDWTRLARRFAALRLLGDDDVQRVDRIWWFGRLIANTDMHSGNLSFSAHTRLALAPCYDMLPMRYAPLAGGEVPRHPPPFDPPLPRPEQQAAWLEACNAALAFWQEAATDSRISRSFQSVCKVNHRLLTEARQSL